MAGRVLGSFSERAGSYAHMRKAAEHIHGKKVHDLVFLLDCGWDEGCSLELLSPLRDVAGHLDAVLLSHPDPLHLGALPVLVSQLQCTAPIYATHPVSKMGQMFLYDQCLNRAAVSEFDSFDLNDIDKAFAHVTTLKYQQVFSLTGAGEGFTITPVAAGHLIGGCSWRITTPEDEDIVYAVHYNHRKQGHLSAAALDRSFLRPLALITDADNALHNPPDIRSARDKELLDSVVSTLRKGGNVLLPIDAAGRVLEVLLLLDRHWEKAKLYFTLVFLAPQARQVLESAKTQLTWMSDAVLQSFERSRDNPFALRHVKLCQSREQLAALPPGPKAVLATLPTLEAGASRDLLVEWAGDPRSLILLTQRPPAGSLASNICQARPAGQPLALKLQLGHREPLAGAELEAFYASRAAHAVEEEEPQALLTPRFSSGSAGKASRSSSTAARLGLGPDEPDEDEDVYEALAPVSDILIDGFIVPKGAAAPMFPFEDEDDELVRDDYGKALRPGEFHLEDGAAPDFIMGEAPKEGDESEQDEARPTKVVTEELALEVRARCLQLDYEGRSDGRSMATILTHIAPRHLVLCHGSTQAVEALSASCGQDLHGLNAHVHCPENGQTVDLSEGAASLRLEVDSSVLAQASMRAMGRYELGWLQALVTQDAPDQAPKLAFAPPRDDDEGTEGGIFIGDVKLSELKAALTKKGISADFSAGSLICAGSILVRRTDDDTGLVLEGPLSDDFYTVRSILYGEYQVC